MFVIDGKQHRASPSRARSEINPRRVDGKEQAIESLLTNLPAIRREGLFFTFITTGL
jgi:hypothetical protein